MKTGGGADGVTAPLKDDAAAGLRLFEFLQVGEVTVDEHGVGQRPQMFSRLHNILGYTNNALTHQQKARALAKILAHAAAGRCTVDREAMPLARVGEAWELQAASARRKLILTP